MFGWFRNLRRRRVRQQEFPSSWAKLLYECVPLTRRLGPEDRAELERHVLVFLDEKYFEGCGGASIDDQVRVTVAGNACLLLLHRDTDYFPGVESILVYPDEFLAPVTSETEYGVVEETIEARAGETSAEGAVVLSWADVLYDVENPHDAENVIIHEFAHQLDEEGRFGEGAPELARHEDYERWARVLGAEYAKLERDSRAGRRTWMDEYGATDPAEFFAVATECFFESPREMKSRQPALYAELGGFYRQDPAGWQAGSRLGRGANG